MIGEIDIAGVFFSPLLLCAILGFAMRLLLSRVLESISFYRLVWQRPLFDTALFLILTGTAFLALRLVTAS